MAKPKKKPTKRKRCPKGCAPVKKATPVKRRTVARKATPDRPRSTALPKSLVLHPKPPPKKQTYAGFRKYNCFDTQFGGRGIPRAKDRVDVTLRWTTRYRKEGVYNVPDPKGTRKVPNVSIHRFPNEASAKAYITCLTRAAAAGYAGFGEHVRDVRVTTKRVSEARAKKRADDYAITSRQYWD